MTKRKKIIYIITFLALLASSFYYITDFVIGQDSGLEDVLNGEIQNLNNGISDKKSAIQKMQDKQKQYEEVIQQKQSEKASLNNQLAILDNRLAKSELDIELVKTEIERVELEMKKTDLNIDEKNQDIEKELEHIADIVRLIYKRDNVSLLEIILVNNSLGDFLSQTKYLEDINQNVSESLDELQKLKRLLEKEKEKLTGQNQDLTKLKGDLDSKQRQLEAEKDNKVVVLSEVSSSERDYQRLLAKAKKEQQQAAAEIASMEKLVRAKLAQLDKGQLEFNENGMIWPVGKNVITAYFHDPDYPFRYIFEHPAIDVRAKQGTPVRAAATGYVARAKDAGKGYSYIMLIHGDGLSTVYGHVSKIMVKEDEYVTQGQVIGLSGGLPGTPGAGSMTTGSHLHFEVRLNGIPVDPLSYLP